MPELGLDGLHRHEEGLGDLAVRQPASGEAGDAQLGRRQRVAAGLGEPARARAARGQLLAGAPGERGGAAADGDVECLAQRLAGVAAGALAAQARTQVAERVPVLEPRLAAGQRRRPRRGTAPSAPTADRPRPAPAARRRSPAARRSAWRRRAPRSASAQAGRPASARTRSAMGSARVAHGEEVLERALGVPARQSQPPAGVEQLRRVRVVERVGLPGAVALDQRQRRAPRAPVRPPRVPARAERGRGVQRPPPPARPRAAPRRRATPRRGPAPEPSRGGARGRAPLEMLAREREPVAADERRAGQEVGGSPRDRARARAPGRAVPRPPRRSRAVAARQARSRPSHSCGRRAHTRARPRTARPRRRRHGGLAVRPCVDSASASAVGCGAPSSRGGLEVSDLGRVAQPALRDGAAQQQPGMIVADRLGDGPAQHRRRLAGFAALQRIARRRGAGSSTPTRPRTARPHEVADRRAPPRAHASAPPAVHQRSPRRRDRVLQRAGERAAA